MAIYLQSPNSTAWEIQVNDSGLLETQTGTGSISTVIINDPTNSSSWQLGIDNNGNITTTKVSTGSYATSYQVASDTGSTNWYVKVDSLGVLSTLPASGVLTYSGNVSISISGSALVIGSNTGFYLQAPNSSFWYIHLDDNGLIQSSTAASGTSATVILNDATNSSSWQIGVDNSGNPSTTKVTTGVYPSSYQVVSDSGSTRWFIQVNSAGSLITTPSSSLAYSGRVSITISGGTAGSQVTLSKSGSGMILVAGTAPFVIGPNAGFDLQAPNSTIWYVHLDDAGFIQTSFGATSTPTTVIINDVTQSSSWQLGVDNNGNLSTTKVTTGSHPTYYQTSSDSGNTHWNIQVTSSGSLQTVLASNVYVGIGSISVLGSSASSLTTKNVYAGSGAITINGAAVLANNGIYSFTGSGVVSVTVAAYAGITIAVVTHRVFSPNELSPNEGQQTNAVSSSLQFVHEATGSVTHAVNSSYFSQATITQQRSINYECLITQSASRSVKYEATANSSFVSSSVVSVFHESSGAAQHGVVIFQEAAGPVVGTLDTTQENKTVFSLMFMMEYESIGKVSSLRSLVWESLVAVRKNENN